MELPFGGEPIYYKYRCGNCGYEQEVPDFVVDGFAAVDGLEPGNMPVLLTSAAAVVKRLNVWINGFKVPERSGGLI
jgi:predicted nucleic acid-binding Zn ribbon protein